MGIYIKGMEMPTACRHGECNFACSAAYQTGVICIVRKQYVVPGEVPGDCPCSLVPPHGRLIDADELLRAAWENFNFVPRWMVKEAPTIIPADKDGET